jgi:hypothetical protein
MFVLCQTGSCFLEHKNVQNKFGDDLSIFFHKCQLREDVNEEFIVAVVLVHTFARRFGVFK